MTKIGYRPEIDGLRAIAVTVVVLYHASSGILPAGFLGVDVFFVISGYLITSILAQEWRTSGRIRLGAFYGRRARRLLPALLLVLSASLAAGLWILPGLDRFQSFAESLASSILFVANLYFERNVGGYFDPASDTQPLLHLWSLGVEEQFYLVFPLLLLVLLRLDKARRLAYLSLLALGSLLLAEYWLGVDPGAAFYQMPARFWELAAGGLVALGAANSLAPGRASVQAWLGLALILVSASGLGHGDRFPGVAAAPAVAGTCLLLHAIHGSRDIGVPGRLLSASPMVYLGLVSYPLYLWHWPILAFDQAARLEPASVSWRLVLCALSVVLAVVTYRFVETPVRDGSHLRPRRFAWGGALLSVGLLGATTALMVADVGRSEAEVVRRMRLDKPADIPECHFDQSSEVTSLKPDICSSTPGLPARIAIWGDSHALAWKPFAWQLASEAGLSAQAHTMDTCPPVLGFSARRTAAPRFGDNCSRLNALVGERVASGQYDLVVLAARWPAHLGAPLQSRNEMRQGNGLQDPKGDLDPAQFVANLRETLIFLSANVAQVYVIAPTPVLYFNAPDCVAARRVEACSRPREEFELLAEPVRQRLLGAADGLPNVSLLDPTVYFCSDAECPAVRDGKGLFWDDDHVSATAAAQFAREFAATPDRFFLRGDVPPSAIEHGDLK